MVAASPSPEQIHDLLATSGYWETAQPDELAPLDRRASQVVELKYFGGMNYDEIGDVLTVSAITVRRDWEFAKAWLHKELTTV